MLGVDEKLGERRFVVVFKLREPETLELSIERWPVRSDTMACVIF
jgi:hypothetical protein